MDLISGMLLEEKEILMKYIFRIRKKTAIERLTFPPRDTPFVLHLPDGTDISAKVCQVADKNNPAVGKSIMSNPNKVLGKWLLREVFELAEGTVVTYGMLESLELIVLFSQKMMS